MLEHTKKLPINTLTVLCFFETGEVLKLPVTEVRRLYRYSIKDNKELIRAKCEIDKVLHETPDIFFSDINQKFSKLGALLKALRLREGYTQKLFAKKLHITQGDLSKMENGKRSIGKIIAKRISKKFGIDYRLLLS